MKPTNSSNVKNIRLSRLPVAFTACALLLSACGGGGSGAGDTQPAGLSDFDSDVNSADVVTDPGVNTPTVPVDDGANESGAGLSLIHI